MSNTDIKDKLDYKLWSTSVTRFNAAKRVESWKHCIRWSLLFTSIYLTILSVMLYSKKIQPGFDDLSQLMTIFLSILILCLSLAVNLNQLDRRATLYHECGRKIRRLLNQLGTASDDSALSNLSAEYDEILDQYENHNSLDFYQFVINNTQKLSEQQKKYIPKFYVLYIWFPAARFIPQIIIYILTIFVPFITIMYISTFKLTNKVRLCEERTTI